MKKKWRLSLWLSGLALAILAFFAIFEQLVCPYDPLGLDFIPLDPPGLKNIFGTDNLGRDVFSRFIVGARISFVVGTVSVFFAATIGILTGLAAAYFRRVQAVFMRIIDAIWAFPMILLALSLATSMEPGVFSVIIAIAIVYSPLFARLVFAQSLSILERDFVQAARAFGCGHMRLLLTHVLPNLAAPILVQATLTVGTAIVLESSLSFLGVGIQPPTPSWGIMLRTGYKWLEQAPWISILPGLGVYVTVVSFSVLGDWLRVILDPKQLTKRV
jgi:ABC-type dipeptide/oligopeptide/nickel transport system permease subunit